MLPECPSVEQYHYNFHDETSPRNETSRILHEWTGLPTRHSEQLVHIYVNVTVYDYAKVGYAILTKIGY